ncbi:hypothetical protein BJX63DRAFT_353438 [Aspergillus granulosus]|uniref:Uncharacterized protein n=1 Tax=Aspergillus granulosus TaxID=176169 RepID=A0ABR4H258_9EURO
MISLLTCVSSLLAHSSSSSNELSFSPCLLLNAPSLVVIAVRESLVLHHFDGCQVALDLVVSNALLEGIPKPDLVPFGFQLLAPCLPIIIFLSRLDTSGSSTILHSGFLRVLPVHLRFQCSRLACDTVLSDDSASAGPSIPPSESSQPYRSSQDTSSTAGSIALPLIPGLENPEDPTRLLSVLGTSYTVLRWPFLLDLIFSEPICLSYSIWSGL